ncbi:unnamed protein product [Ectocarpus sp. 12 AP-2014]
MRDGKGENEFRVVVGGQKLEEISHKDGKTYIQMMLFSKVSYGVEYTEEVKGLGGTERNTQKWPVSPYTVAVRNNSGKGNFAQLCVDGQKIAEKYVPAGDSVIFEGIPTEEGIQELLFSLPRYATLREKEIGGQSLPDAVASELGTIKVVWRDCALVGKDFADNYRTYAAASSYKQANKTDAKRTGGAGAGAGEGEKFASTTRAGKVIGMNEARSCVVNRYQYEGEPWSATLLYRTKDYLEKIGVIPKDMSPEEVAERRRKRLARRKRRKLQEEAAAGGAFVPPPVPVSLVDGPPPVAAEEGEGEG